MLVVDPQGEFNKFFSESFLLNLAKSCAVSAIDPTTYATRAALTPDVSKGRDSFRTQLALARAYIEEIDNEYNVSVVCIFLVIST